MNDIEMDMYVENIIKDISPDIIIDMDEIDKYVEMLLAKNNIYITQEDTLIINKQNNFIQYNSYKKNEHNCFLQ